MANILDKRDKSLVGIPSGDVLIDKVEKYKWARPTTPGEMRMIHKNQLNVDDRYQRERISEEAVRKIARNWDWTLFGVIKVAQRPDKTLWVFDGGHRTRAAFYRSDITELPCIVFDMADISDEARAFIAAARLTKAINSLDTFRAATTAKEPAALKTAEILARFGLTATKNPTNATHVKCIHTLEKAVAQNEDLAVRVLEMSLSLANERPVAHEVFDGLFTLAAHFNGQDVLTNYADAFARTTQQELLKIIRSFRAEIGKGGSTISAKAIMGLLNKGKKTRKLTW